MADISQLEVNGTTYDICDATARDSLSNYVLKTGDTMTGDLVMDDCTITVIKGGSASIKLKDPGVTLSTAADNGVTTNTYPGFKITDSNDTNFAVYEVGASDDGQVQIAIKARNIDTNGDLVENLIYMGVKKDGTQTIYLSCKDAWRAALKPTQLYNNTSGSNGTITLSSSAANYNHMRIYYKSTDDATHQVSSVDVYSPNGKVVILGCVDGWKSGNT